MSARLVLGLVSSLLKLRARGTEFSGAETAGKIHPKRPAIVRQRPPTLKTGGKIPVETPSFRLITVFQVREDWVVVCAVRCEPVSA
jgi:hypothetical protein